MTSRWLSKLLLAPLWLFACTSEPCALPDAGEPPALRPQEGEADASNEPRPRGLARNVIVVMGDGMGPEQLSTARYVKEGRRLRVDELAGPALANTDSLTTLRASDPELSPTDSAAAATAIATGVRVDDGVLSVAPDGSPLETVLEACRRAGKATGLVTTSYFFDASPAAFAVHQPQRGMYEAIVHELLSETQPDVIMGNEGSWAFGESPNVLDFAIESSGYFVVRDVIELAAWDPVTQPRLLGLFKTDFVSATPASEPFSLTPALERRADSPDPALATMTERAIKRLARDEHGFFLFVEDELLDELGHRGPAEVDWANRAYPAQAAALDDAVGVAIDWVHAHSSFEETLIVVLADHETGGYHYDHALGPASGSFSAFNEGAEFRSGNHTRTEVAVYALGPGSPALDHVHEHADTHLLLLGELE